MSNLNRSDYAELYTELTEGAVSLPQDDLNKSIPGTRIILTGAKTLHSIGGSIASDSLLLSRTSRTVVGLTSNATNIVNKYNQDKLADHIRSHKDLWHFSFPYEVPVFSYLYGTLGHTPTPQRPRAYRKIDRQVEGSVKAPTKVAKINSKEKPRAIIELKNYLKTRPNGECSYFHLILDPTSFTRTIENIFNVSSLIKNNDVGIYIDADIGLPFLKCVQNKQSSDRKQFIQSIDKKQWSDLIEALRITEPLRQVEEDMSDDNES